MLKKRKAGNMNLFLLLGIFLTLTLIIMAIFGSSLLPYDLGERVTIMKDPSINKLVSAPFSPSSSHWFGTDEMGVDMLDKLLNGAKYTLSVVLVISLSRVAIAIPLGLIAGYWSKYFKRPLQYMNRAWGSMPVFLFVYMIIYPIVKYLHYTGNLQLILLWLVLTIAGLPPLIETIRGHVENIKTYEFMDGVKILGAGPFYTIRKHIMPHISPYLVIILALEIAQILWLIGQLGIFHLFVGGTIEKYDYELGFTEFYSPTNEWSGLLGYGRKWLLTAPWIPLSPLLAFVYAIVSFQLLSEGLKRRMNRNRVNYDL